VDIRQQSLLLIELSDLLQKQISAARKGDYNALESMIAGAGSIVEQLKTSGAFQNPQFNDQKRALTKLYRTVELAVSAEKNNTEKQKKQALASKNALTAYNNT